MKLYFTFLLILVFPFFGLAQDAGSDKQSNDSSAVVIDTKTLQKDLQKHLKDAKALSAVNQNPDFANARKEIVAAMESPLFDEFMSEIYLEAGNVEYNCYDVERNKPASGGKIDYDVLYSATMHGFLYFSQAYTLYSEKKGKSVAGIKAAIQKKAWTLFNVTDGFRANAAYAFEQKDWKTSHDCFDLFVNAVHGKLLNDYASTGSRIRNTLNLYKSDSIIAHAKYFRAIAALNSEDAVLAIKDFEEIKYDGFEQNVVLQELCHLYREVGEEEKFEKLLIEGSELLPNEPWYARNLVNIYLDRRDYHVASEMIDKLIKVDANNPVNLALKGQLAERLGDESEASEYYERSYAIDSLNSEINSHLGRIWYNRATKIEGEWFNQREYKRADAESLPIYIKALEYYVKAFDLEKSHRDMTIAKAIRSVLYKQFTQVDCPNKDELIEQYNEVSRAYGMTEFPK